MNNYINYYYNLYPRKIEQKDSNYFFLIDEDKYYFIPYNRLTDEIQTLIILNKEMIKRNSLVHEIILNKDNQGITNVDNVPYILLRVYINEDKMVDLGDILFMLDNNEIAKTGMDSLFILNFVFISKGIKKIRAKENLIKV